MMEDSPNMQNRIKGAFSLRQINHAAMAEKLNKRHPGNMHLWWNRSLIESSQLLLNAVLVNERDALANGNGITIVDPFSGFGGLTIAAVMLFNRSAVRKILLNCR